MVPQRDFNKLIHVGAVKGLKIRRTTIESVQVYLEKQGYL